MNVYATYVVTPSELAQAQRLYESIRVFDKKTPFYFVSPDLTALSVRRLDDVYRVEDFSVAQVPWPEAGVPYKSLWQLPHLLKDYTQIMHLPYNVVLNRDLRWLFDLFPKYSHQLEAGIGFGCLDGEMVPDAFLMNRENELTWRFVEAVRDMEVSSWAEGAYFLSRSWNVLQRNNEASPVMKLIPLAFNAVQADRVEGTASHVRVSGLPTVRNLWTVPKLPAF